MSKNTESSTDTEAKKKADARATLLVRIIFSGLVVALIAVMAAISIYGDKQLGDSEVPADSAAATDH